MDGKTNEEGEVQGEKIKAAPLKLVLKLHRNVNDDVKSKWTVAENNNTPKSTNTTDLPIPPLQEPELAQQASNVAISGLKIKINRKQLVQVDEETKKKKEVGNLKLCYNINAKVAEQPTNTTKIKIPKEFYSTSKKSKTDLGSRTKLGEKLKKKKRKFDDFESESESLDEDQMDIASSSDEKELREDAFDLPADEIIPKTKTARTDSKSQKMSQDSADAPTKTPSSKKPRQLSLQATLGKILKQLMKYVNVNLNLTCTRRDTLHFFFEPVTDDQAPDYSIIVKNPMDFSTMKQKLESGAYPTIEQFELICSNCMLYNAPETIYFKEAKKLLAFGNDILKSWKEKINPELSLATTNPLTESERVLRSSAQPSSPTLTQAAPSKMDTRQSKSADGKDIKYKSKFAAKLKSIVREASKVQLPTLNQIVQPLLSIPSSNAPLYAAPLPAYATTTVPYTLFVRRKIIPQHPSETRIEDQENQSASTYYSYTPNYLNYRTKPIPVLKKSESAQWDLESFMKLSTSETQGKIKAFLSSVNENRAPPLEIDSKIFDHLNEEYSPIETTGIDLDELLSEFNGHASFQNELLDQPKDQQPKVLPPQLQELLDKNTFLLYQLQLHQYERGGGPPSEKEQRIGMVPKSDVNN